MCQIALPWRRSFVQKRLRYNPRSVCGSSMRSRIPFLEDAAAVLRFSAVYPGRMLISSNAVSRPDLLDRW